MASLRGLYRHLPEEVRRCTRPLNLIDETASLLPDALRGPMVATTESMRLLLRLPHARYPVRRLEGRGARGIPLTCLLAMDDHAALYWRRVLFAGPPREETVGDVRAVGVAAAAARAGADVDLALWQAPWPVGSAGGTVRVPSLVTLWLPTDRPLDDVFVGEPAGREQRRGEIRRVQRLGLVARVTNDPLECERFRVELYEPYVRARFGELVEPLPPHAFRHARRHGFVLLLERDGHPAAGALLEHSGELLRLRAFGAERAGPVPAPAAIAACYYHVIRLAVEGGFRRLSFGTCRPVLSDGVLHYKRKWGGRLGAPLGTDGFLLRYRNTAAVRATLAAAPLVLDLGHGRLATLGGTPDAATELSALAPRLCAPGADEAVCLVDDVPAHAPPSIRLVPPADVWPPQAAA